MAVSCCSQSTRFTASSCSIFRRERSRVSISSSALRSSVIFPPRSKSFFRRRSFSRSSMADSISLSLLTRSATPPPCSALAISSALARLAALAFSISPGKASSFMPEMSGRPIWFSEILTGISSLRLSIAFLRALSMARRSSRLRSPRILRRPDSLSEESITPSSVMSPQTSRSSALRFGQGKASLSLKNAGSLRSLNMFSSTMPAIRLLYSVWETGVPSQKWSVVCLVSTFLASLRGVLQTSL